MSILSVFLLLLISCSTQKKEVVYDSIVLKAKETSLYTDRVDWPNVNKEYKRLTAGKEGMEEMQTGLQYLINSLEDKHATIRRLKDYSIMVYSTAESDEEDNRDGDFIRDVINDVSAQFSYKLLNDQVGYLKVVGIGPGDLKEQSDFIRAGLVDLKSQGVDKWILDLRCNGGGNVEPMMSGLAPLIGEGYVGGGIDNNGDTRQSYKIVDGKLDVYGRISCDMNNEPSISSSEPVAVLLSRYTVSSGEMLAISLKGRPNTRFIGEQTGGYTTGNGFDPVNEEIALVISQTVFTDRNNNIYQSRVDVDESMEFIHTIDLYKDAQITRAIDWLKE